MPGSNSSSNPTANTAPVAFDPAGEIQQLKELADSVQMPAALKDKVDKMLTRLVRMLQMGTFTKEYEPVEQYIRWVIQIPWGKYTQDNLNLENAKEELNKYHYGLDMVKDTILDYLAVLKLQIEGAPVMTASVQSTQQAAVDPHAQAKAVWPPPAEAGPDQQVPTQVPEQVQGSQVPGQSSQVQAQGSQVPALQGQSSTLEASVPQSSETTQPALGAGQMPNQVPDQVSNQMSSQMSKLQGSSANAPVLCFVGIQGVGKTSIAKSIANALGRKFVRISLGALGDVSQIRGIPKGELNAEPGQIIKGLIRAGSMNPLILLDEIDKTSSESGLRADLMAALLEILDPEQNSTFVDHYLDHPVDLSQCMFITTSNNLGGLSAALLDRLEIIRFGSYTDEDKVQIAKNYMLRRVREATGITEQQLSFDEDVWPLVIRPLGFDAGVRELERTLTNLARRVARMIVEGKGTSFRVTKDNFREFIPADIGVYS